MPLHCVIRNKSTSDLLGAFEPVINQTCCVEAGSVEQELISRATHRHPNFKDNNEKAHCLLEESTCEQYIQ